MVYVAGDGRSGSTLLSRMLGQIPGWFSAGEVRYVWERGMLDDRRCQCGQPFHECPLWTRVVDRLPGRPTKDELGRLLEAEHRLLRTRRALTAVRLASRPTDYRLREPHYAARLSDLYATIRSVTGCSVLVDSSKLAAYGLLLRGDAHLRVKVVHLVRDPRASAYSWQRFKPLRDDHAATHMQRRGVLRSSAVWSSGNLLVERLLRRPGTAFVRVRYEDLVTDPDRTLRTLTGALGWPALQLPVASDGVVHLETGHAVAGNPDRHDDGALRLRLDDEWRSRMPAREQRLVYSLTRPLSVRYGYGR